MNKKCAFLTLEERSDFCIYDHLLHNPFKRRGWEVEEIPWNNPETKWNTFDAVIIRSTWDYQATPEKFLLKLEDIEKQTRLFNSADICRWNISKKYLNDLQLKGVDIIPTQWMDQLDNTEIPSLFQYFNIKTLIVKPLIGANADDTFVLKYDNTETWDEAINVFKSKKVIIQPFIDSVLQEGEYSLFYFGGDYSHAILKKPSKGDFRVQEEHGGLISSVKPSESLIISGNKAIKAIGQKLLYARIDFLKSASGKPLLIEMELIEPSLYFHKNSDSPEFFVKKFVEMIEKDH